MQISALEASLLHRAKSKTAGVTQINQKVGGGRGDEVGEENLL